jgi:gliding motility-associated-like protein
VDNNSDGVNDNFDWGSDADNDGILNFLDTDYWKGWLDTNGDGVNDIFRVRGLNIEVQNCKIYNRYGNEIYNGTLENGWDGKYNNELVESGVYTYTLEYLNKKTKILYQKNGALTIMR